MLPDGGVYVCAFKIPALKSVVPVARLSASQYISCFAVQTYLFNRAVSSNILPYNIGLLTTFTKNLPENNSRFFSLLCSIFIAKSSFRSVGVPDLADISASLLEIGFSKVNLHLLLVSK